MLGARAGDGEDGELTTGGDPGAANTVESVSIIPTSNDVVYSGYYRGHVDFGSGQQVLSPASGNAFYAVKLSF